MPAGGALVGMAIGAAAGGGITTIATYGAIGAAIGSGVGLFSKQTGLKAPNLKDEGPKITVEEVEAQEQGWANINKRASGRRATILTSPQLSQQTLRTKKATLLGG